MKCQINRCPLIESPAAFTLVELLMVLALLAIIASALMPALAKSKPNSLAFQCLNNNRQLCTAWRMYTDDNHDLIVYSSDDGSGTSNPRNQYAWTLLHMDFSSSNPSLWDPSLDIYKRPLWPYTAKDASIYKCPADRSFIVVNNVAKPRVRSMSMNLYLGGFAGTGGGWSFADSIRIFLKTTEVTLPGPANTFVFLDQRPDSINWGNFMTDMTGYYPTSSNLYTLRDLPGMVHDRGCGFSFADGHAELHRWTDPRTTPPMFNYLGAVDSIASPRNADVAWLQDHASRPK